MPMYARKGDLFCYRYLIDREGIFGLKPKYHDSLWLNFKML